MLTTVRNGNIAGTPTENHAMLAIKKFDTSSVRGHEIETVMISDPIRSDMKTTFAMI